MDPKTYKFDTLSIADVYTLSLNAVPSPIPFASKYASKLSSGT